MDDYLEIDLRKVLRNVFTKWYWVLLPALILGVGAFLYSYFQPDYYQVKSQFALTTPPYTVSFDDRFVAAEIEQPSQEAVRNVVLNNKIVAELIDIWENPNSTPAALTGFRTEHLTVEIDEKVTLISLIVMTESPENAALIANTWVDLAMAAVEEKIYGMVPDQAALLAEQTAAAKAQLDASGQRLVTFADHNALSALRNEHLAQLAEQVEIMQAIRILETARDDVQILLSQLALEPQDLLLDPSYRLSYSMIQQRVFNPPIVVGIGGEIFSEETRASFPLVIAEGLNNQLVIDTNELPENRTVGAFSTLLTTWLEVSEEKMASLQSKLETITSQIGVKEAQITALENELISLNTEYDQYLSVYELMLVKEEEIKLSMPGGESGYVRLVNAAVEPLPGEKLSHHTLRNTALGLVLGGFLGVIAVILIDWWKEPQQKAPAGDE